MQRRATMVTVEVRQLINMNALAFIVCSVVGSAVAWDAAYNVGPNEPYAVVANPNYIQEPSQRLFWSNGQGTNQVGGTGLWAHLTNKFPFLGNMFGRMELPAQYGAPQYDIPSQYGAPAFQPQYFQPQQYHQQAFQYPGFRQANGRDVGFTDDAVIVTPPHVPIAQPAPAPAPLPEPNPGYEYQKPQYRLDLPHKK